MAIGPALLEPRPRPVSKEKRHILPVCPAGRRELGGGKTLAIARNPNGPPPTPPTDGQSSYSKPAQCRPLVPRRRSPAAGQPGVLVANHQEGRALFAPAPARPVRHARPRDRRPADLLEGGRRDQPATAPAWRQSPHARGA